MQKVWNSLRACVFVCSSFDVSLECGEVVFVCIGGFKCFRWKSFLLLLSYTHKTTQYMFFFKLSLYLGDFYELLHKIPIKESSHIILFCGYWCALSTSKGVVTIHCVLLHARLGVNRSILKLLYGVIVNSLTV